MQNTGRGAYIAANIVCALASVYISVHFIMNGPAIRIWLGPVSLLFLLIPPVAERLFRMRLGYPMKTWVVGFCLIAYHFGVALRWYYDVWYWDHLAHFLSGILFTAAGFCFFAKIAGGAADRRANPLLQLTYAIFFSMAVAVCWEIFEYLGFVMFGIDSQHHFTEGVMDTMEDIVACVLGSLVMAGDYLVWLRTRKSLCFPIVTGFDKVNGAR